MQLVLIYPSYPLSHIHTAQPYTVRLTSMQCISMYRTNCTDKKHPIQFNSTHTHTGQTHVEILFCRPQPELITSASNCDASQRNGALLKWAARMRVNRAIPTSVFSACLCFVCTRDAVSVLKSNPQPSLVRI